MNKSLAELFLISEQFDPTQELIASILINTTDGDEDTEADLKLKELAKQVELGQITVDNAKAELSILTQGETPEGDLDEDIVAEEFDDEGRMAKSDLLKLTQYSAKLYKALEDNEQLPGWIQAKITLAADYIGTVKHYLEGEEVMGNQEAPTDQLKEAADYTETYHWEDFHLEIFTNKPVKELCTRVFLPLSIDGKMQLNLTNYKNALLLPDNYEGKFGTKGVIVARELGYVERDFEGWKDRFELEGDEEVAVTCDGSTCTVHIEAIAAESEKYTAGKAKGNTKDIYESSLLNILSK
tara:strand:+ start:7418 stop:8308 length:891 start_codon:yes stop_codon:yes gene_type:complete